MKKIFLFSLPTLFIISCGNNKEEVEARAKEISDSIINAQMDSIEWGKAEADPFEGKETKIVNADSNFKEFGFVEGQASYPSEELPENYKIYFKSKDLIDASSTYIVKITDIGNNLKYKIKLPIGWYDVYAKGDDNEKASGIYSQAVLCGLSVKCKDHTKIPVMVKQNLTTTDINPGDWYW